MENEILWTATLRGLYFYRVYYRAIKKGMGTWFFGSLAEYLLRDIEQEIDKQLNKIIITEDSVVLNEALGNSSL